MCQSYDNDRLSASIFRYRFPKQNKLKRYVEHLEFLGSGIGLESQIETYRLNFIGLLNN